MWRPAERGRGAFGRRRQVSGGALTDSSNRHGRASDRPLPLTTPAFAPRLDSWQVPWQQASLSMRVGRATRRQEKQTRAHVLRGDRPCELVAIHYDRRGFRQEAELVVVVKGKRFSIRCAVSRTSFRTIPLEPREHIKTRLPALESSPRSRCFGMPDP